MGNVFEFSDRAELEAKLAKYQEELGVLEKLKEHRSDIWPTIQKKLRIHWITGSNALEGSTLNFAETLFFLEEGLTVEGKPLKDFVDARNHADAIEFLMDVIKDKRPISTSLIKETNALLMRGVDSTPAIDQQGKKVRKPANPGAYKLLPNHVLQSDGTIHKYVDPVNVAEEMEELVYWINGQADKMEPIIIAALAHYNFVRIHPFDDGNGRGARILMNLILIKAGLIPITIRAEERRSYLSAIRKGDEGELTAFINFIIQSMASTLRIVHEDLK